METGRVAGRRKVAGWHLSCGCLHMRGVAGGEGLAGRWAGGGSEGAGGRLEGGEAAGTAAPQSMHGGTDLVDVYTRPEFNRARGSRHRRGMRLDSAGGPGRPAGQAARSASTDAHL